MSGHRWKVKRVQAMREGELQAAVCEGCGAYRLTLLPPGGGVREVFATDPDPLPENCRSAQNRREPTAQEARHGVFEGV